MGKAAPLRREAGKPEACDLLIRNGYLVTLDPERRILDPGAIAIRGNAIVALGDDALIARAYHAARTLDAEGGTVHPGLIDAHNHIVHGTGRGVFGAGVEQPISFAEWKAGVTPEDEHIATQLAALEMLRHGFTTFIEPGSAFDTDAVAAAVEAVGMRALLAGCYLWDQVAIMKHLGGLDGQALYDRAPARLERCLDELGRELRRNRDPDGRVHGYVALYGLGTASDRLLQAAKALADAEGVAFHQHEGYIPAASLADRAALGRSRIRHLAELGVLGPNAALVHMNVLEDADIPLLVQSGVTVIWCPVAYMSLGIADAAPCRIPELRERGMTVALGLDGALDSAIGDAALLAHLVAASIRRPLSPGAILEMETLGAARAAGLADRIGSLEAGKRADIVIRSMSAAEAFPAVSPVHQLALTARAGTVETVVVNGEIVMRHGRSTRVDEEGVLAEAHRSVTRRMARLGLRPAAPWPARR
jgi:cytosine/adenosine deaminase-related metal-dependent hydrolase